MFLALGAACCLASASVTEISVRYDDACAAGASAAERGAALAAAGGAGRWCALRAPPPRRPLRPPVRVLYEMTGFHQNHRRYVRSRDEAQLRGDPGAGGPAAERACAPRGAPSNASLPPPVPCGLVAWSAFNDSVRVFVDGREAAVDGGGVRSRADVRGRFGPVPAAGVNADPASRGGREPVGLLRDDGALQAWMRPAALASFRKPLGSLTGGGLPAGAPIALVVTNAFNTYAIDGTKRVVVTDASWLGGRNFALAWAALGLGGVSGLTGLLLALAACCGSRSRRSARVADETAVEGGAA